MSLLLEQIADATTMSARVLKLQRTLSVARLEDEGFEPEWFKEMGAARRRVYAHKKDLEVCMENVQHYSLEDNGGPDSDEFKAEMERLKKIEKLLVWDTYEVFKISLRFGIERENV